MLCLSRALARARAFTVAHAPAILCSFVCSFASRVCAVLLRARAGLAWRAASGGRDAARDCETSNPTLHCLAPRGRGVATTKTSKHPPPHPPPARKQKVRYASEAHEALATAAQLSARSSQRGSDDDHDARRHSGGGGGERSYQVGVAWCSVRRSIASCV